MYLGHDLPAISSHFVTYGHVIQPDQTWDKYGILTPKINLLIQKSLKQKLRTTDVFYYNNKSASFIDYRNHIYLFLKSLYKFLSFCHIGHVILAASECALPNAPYLSIV